MFYNTIRSIFIISFFVSLEGCSCIHKIPIPYNQDMNQGNVINLEHQKMLKIGMTKKQVLSILGTPITRNIYQPEQWNYIQYHKTNKGKKNILQFTLFFKNDKLIKWSGDEFPKQREYKIDIIKKITID
ncbi:MAG: outer membrane protein assembly factor BamE [Candidatus Kinetoplastibacterium crithidii]|nr:MAG: outer membrane protein assembly factor BamE [Candidatus Kinetoplastibacterium crithidii]